MSDKANGHLSAETVARVNQILHKLKKEKGSFAARKINNISPVPDSDGQQFQVTFSGLRGGPLEIRLIILGVRPANEPPIKEVQYVEIPCKDQRKKDKIERSVIKAIESSF